MQRPFRWDVCPAARFLWSCFRKIVGGSWTHNNFPNMFLKARSLLTPARPTLCVAAGMLLWTLWNVQNKLVIEHIIPSHATDAIFKMSGFLQLWRPLSKRRDHDAIDSTIVGLRSTAARLSPPCAPPPPLLLRRRTSRLVFSFRFWGLYCCSPERPMFL